MIVVDVETTGLIPGKSGVVAIGAIEFEHPQNQFYAECRIGKTTLVDPFALEVNGFTPDQIYDPTKPTQAAAVRSFLAWADKVTDRTMGGHNTIFDIRMLRAVCRSAKIKTSLLYGSIDLHNLIYARLLQMRQPIPLNHYGWFSAKADDVHQFVGLPAEPQPHRALTGAKMEAEAMSRLLHGQLLLAEFSKYAIPDYLLIRNGSVSTPKSPRRRPGLRTKRSE
ncbi:3'-5' exonuclease [Candidatus Microgenomates bacterium]|nr:3'-5' exonuclease [Candidatus Microgenomates bacterium]